MSEPTPEPIVDSTDPKPQDPPAPETVERKAFDEVTSDLHKNKARVKELESNARETELKRLKANEEFDLQKVNSKAMNPLEYETYKHLSMFYTDQGISKNLSQVFAVDYERKTLSFEFPIYCASFDAFLHTMIFDFLMEKKRKKK